jgi:peptide/nickel transport system ATP-binding protein
VPWRAARSDAQALLRSFDLPDSRDFLDRYPSQVSVGQAQRVLIAMALLHRPSLVIADEVTSALDLLTQREVLSSLRRANIEWGTALLHITHDLLSVPEVCRDVVVLEQGRLVESGPCSEVLSNPRQAYTRRLIAALPTGGWNPSAAALHS